MFLPRHVLNHLIELPIGQQVSIATKMVPVATGLRHGHHTHIMKPARDLTRKEAGRAIGPKGIRPICQSVRITDNTAEIELIKSE